MENIEYTIVFGLGIVIGAAVALLATWIVTQPQRKIEPDYSQPFPNYTYTYKEQDAPPTNTPTGPTGVTHLTEEHEEHLSNVLRGDA